MCQITTFIIIFCQSSPYKVDENTVDHQNGVVTNLVTKGDQDRSEQQNCGQ